MRHLINRLIATCFFAQIPGTEGRAGMAAIHDPDEEVDLHQLALGVKEKLPAFARPLFVRFVKHLDITGKVFFFPIINQF